jgi:VanZ family protein
MRFSPAAGFSPGRTGLGRIKVAVAPAFLLSCAVRDFRSFLWYWAPVIVLMTVIFTASTDAGSFNNSSRIIGPFLHWLFPAMSQETIGTIIFYIRKCGHFSEYALLTLLVWRAFRKPAWRDPRPWLWSQAAEALWFAVLYAATDEFHQTFVPTREGCVRDVLIDSSGAVTALLILRLIGRWVKLWPGEKQPA